MSRSWQKGSTAGWRRTRAFVLDRDRNLCQLRLPGICTTRATHAHHVKGRSVTGDDPRFIVAACPACNLAVGDPTHHRHDPPPQPTSSW